MYFSIYRIHTDKGTYVGQTSDLVSRMLGHYSCKVWKKGCKIERLPIYNAIRDTPDYRLTGSELNIQYRSKGRTLYLDGSYELEKELRVDRSSDNKITLDMKYQFDLMMTTYKLSKMTL